MTMPDGYADTPQHVDYFEQGSGTRLTADRGGMLVDAMATSAPQASSMALLPAELLSAFRPLLARSSQ
ncbi:hypothetical protein [Herbaspirillum sp. alder98]|uniref:hypothetical protein n=1 Tax=Herbaspirillum sp. alder98 TaxID=2913096 RepID=UPI001CD8E54C|nr:hypothetical protein [Herbaspirillum sp. alder98]MCA1323188.1 hypothetical protein [Herbaspirillum sp. alder98]